MLTRYYIRLDVRMRTISDCAKDASGGVYGKGSLLATSFALIDG